MSARGSAICETGCRVKELAIVRWNALTGRYNKHIEAILRTGESR